MMSAFFVSKDPQGPINGVSKVYKVTGTHIEGRLHGLMKSWLMIQRQQSKCVPAHVLCVR